MILTIAIDPSIEKTAIVDGIEISNTNEIVDYHMTLGASGIYGAVAVKMLQGESYVLGFAGGLGGRFIKNFMDKNKIKSDILFKDSETPSILNIIDSVNGTSTRFVDHTFTYNRNDGKNLKHKLNNNLKDVQTLILDSNSDGEASSDIIVDIMKTAKVNNLKLVIALKGNTLRKALAYHPYCLVLNKEDLRELMIEDIGNEEEILKELRKLLVEERIHYIGFNSGDKVYMISKTKIVAINKAQIDQETNNVYKSLITGVLAISISRKYEIEKMIKLIGGFIQSLDLSNFPAVLNRKEIDDYSKKVKSIEIYNARNNKIML